MLTIPRAEIHAIAKRHRVDYDMDFDPSAEWVRATAKALRQTNHLDGSGPQSAEADDLDALVDRYENARDELLQRGP